MHLSTTPTSLVKYNATALRQDLPSHFISTRPAFRCSNWTHRCFWHLQSGIFSSPSDKRRVSSSIPRSFQADVLYVDSVSRLLPEQAGRVHAAAGVPTNNAPATAAVPLLLAQSYFALQHPAVLNMRYSQAVKAGTLNHATLSLTDLRSEAEPVLGYYAGVCRGSSNCL